MRPLDNTVRKMFYFAVFKWGKEQVPSCFLEDSPLLLKKFPLELFAFRAFQISHLPLIQHVMLNLVLLLPHIDFTF